MGWEDRYYEALAGVISIKNEGMTEALSSEADQKLKIIGGQKISREEYGSIIRPYWAKYGREPDAKWFELYGSRDGITDPRFIPDTMYYLELMPYLNNLQLWDAYHDKCQFDRFLPEVKQPETVCKRMAGVYYDSRMRQITRSEAIGLCREQSGDVVIKPSLYSSRGHGVEVVGNDRKTDEIIGRIFDETGMNFIAQKKVIQHPTFAKLCPDVVNTTRIMSVFIDGKVYITESAIRFGEKNMDHVSLEQGGYICEAGDGVLNSKGLSGKQGWVDLNEKGITEPGFALAGFDKIYDEVRQIHPLLPHFRVIGWDFIIDEDCEPVMIEYNIVPGITPQLCCCKPIFGEMTDWILDDFFFHRTLEKTQQQGRLVQIGSN